MVCCNCSAGIKFATDSQIKFCVTIQREAQHPSPAGAGRVRRIVTILSCFHVLRRNAVFNLYFISLICESVAFYFYCRVVMICFKMLSRLIDSDLINNTLKYDIL